MPPSSALHSFLFLSFTPRENKGGRGGEIKPIHSVYMHMYQKWVFSRVTSERPAACLFTPLEANSIEKMVSGRLVGH